MATESPQYVTASELVEEAQSGPQTSSIRSFTELTQNPRLEALSSGNTLELTDPSIRSSLSIASGLELTSAERLGHAAQLERPITPFRSSLPVTLKRRDVNPQQSPHSLVSPQPHIPSSIPESPKAASRNTGQKWSSYIDTSARLLNDSLGQIEYVKGIGARAVSDYHGQHTEKQLLRMVDLGDHEFLLKSVSTISRFALAKIITWKTTIDGFQVTLENGDILIPACNIMKVYYNIGQRMYALESRSPEAGVHSHSETTLLQIGGDEAEPYRLRSLLEKRFGAVKVQKMDTIWFEEQVQQLERSRATSHIVSKSQSKISNTLANISYESNEWLKELGESSRIYDNGIARHILTEDERPQQYLRYQSGEIIRRHDLVVRLRDPLDIQHGKNKFNHLDVYDGPFQIVELPSSSDLATDIFSDSDNDNSASRYTSPDSKSHRRLIQDEKLIKLDFPEISSAEPWTKLKRLRPVYKINRNITRNVDDKLTYYYVSKTNDERTVINTEDLADTDQNDEADIEGVVKIRSGVYARVKYVAAEGPEDDDRYEVEKLRGKQVYRYDRSEYPDERMDDDRIRRYIEEEGGMVADDEVLVVKYLIHWAGWPSEDDSWERGQGNVPQEFIDAWNASEAAKRDAVANDDETYFQEGRLKMVNGHLRSAKKRRVSERRVCAVPVMR